MLISIVGPDNVGKTTLFNALRGLVKARFLPSVPMHPDLMPHISLLEQRTLSLWAGLYVPSQLYISDRCPFVDNIVYAKQYNRPLTPMPWVPELRLIYLRAPAFVLENRPKDVLPQDYVKSLALYDEVIAHYRYTLLDATSSIESLTIKALEYINAQT